MQLPFFPTTKQEGLAYGMDDGTTWIVGAEPKFSTLGNVAMAKFSYWPMAISKAMAKVFL